MFKIQMTKTVLKFGPLANEWDSHHRGVSVSCFASRFCSCLVHQAQLPNKLGNYTFKLRLAMTEKDGWQ